MLLVTDFSVVGLFLCCCWSCSHGVSFCWLSGSWITCLLASLGSHCHVFAKELDNHLYWIVLPYTGFFLPSFQKCLKISEKYLIVFLDLGFFFCFVFFSLMYEVILISWLLVCCYDLQERLHWTRRCAAVISSQWSSRTWLGRRMLFSPQAS